MNHVKAIETLRSSEMPVMTLEHDEALLQHIIDSPSVTVDEAYVATLNSLVAATQLGYREASTSNYSLLKDSVHTESETSRRQKVYAHLGWIDSNHIVHESLMRAAAQKNLPPPKRVLANLQELYPYAGDELLYLLQRSAKFFSVSTHRLNENLAYLTKQGVDPLFVMNRNTRLICEEEAGDKLLRSAQAALRAAERSSEHARRRQIGHSAVADGVKIVADEALPEGRLEGLRELAVLAGVDTHSLRAATSALSTCSTEEFAELLAAAAEHEEVHDEPLGLRKLLFRIRDMGL